MKKRTPQNYTAFISYASEDEDIVKNIEVLFKKMGHNIFYAPIVLKQKAGDDWVKQVIKSIKESRCIIPIYTRNSIRKPWVLYELGVADAFGLPKYPARVDEVSPEEASSPGKQVQIFKLSEMSDLVELFTNVVNLQENPKNDKEKRASITTRIENSLKDFMIKGVPISDIIIKLAKTRDIFIAGNTPKNIKKDKNIKSKQIMTEQVYERKIKDFLSLLTTRLLEKGFNVSSCPQVDSVGKVVSTQAIAWITSNNQPTDRYHIGGIYPIDRELRRLDVDKRFKEVWETQLLKFRKWYLEPQEWLLIVGGNEGTEEEYSAANELNVKVFPFPCFGGAGQKLWNTYNILQRPPCKGCKRLDGNCGKQEIDQLINTLLFKI